MKNRKNITGVVISAAVVGGIVYALIPKKETITVRDKIWERKVDIEEYTEIEESGWTVPAGATVVSVSQREKSSDVTFKANGDIVEWEGSKDGTYKPYYTYRVKRWVIIDTKITTGTSEVTPYYDDTESLPEGRRYGTRTDTYNVIDTNGNTWVLDQNKWAILKSGDNINIKHGKSSNVIKKMELINPFVNAK